MLRLTSLTLTFFIVATTHAFAQSCSFSVTNVNFGNVDTLAGAAVDTTGTVNISCTGGLLGATFRICLNLNAGAGGATSSTRHMRNAANAALNYGLFQDAARSVPWGSRTQTALGTPVGLQLAAPALGSASTTRTIYGRVLANQQSSTTGAYASSFSGAATGALFNYRTSGALNCTQITQNQATPTFAVQANVVPNCRVTAQNINFGNHGILDTNVDANGGLGVTCTPGTAYNIGLNNGLTGTGPTARRMTLGGQAVTYGLYKDAARSQPWGNSGGERIPGTGSGATQSLPVYGRVQPQQTPAPGTYTDTVVVTVTY